MPVTLPDDGYIGNNTILEIKHDGTSELKKVLKELKSF